MLDQMAGSGTTMRAAADLQRDAIGIEIYQPHGELIRRRMSQQTMGVAVQNSAATFYCILLHSTNLSLPEPSP